MDMNSGNLGASLLALTLLFAAPLKAETRSSPTLDTKAIDQAIGKTGEMKERCL